MVINKPLGRKLADWEGVDPIWSVAPITLWFFYLILRVNYERVATDERVTADAVTEREVRERLARAFKKGEEVYRTKQKEAAEGNRNT